LHFNLFLRVLQKVHFVIHMDHMTSLEIDRLNVLFLFIPFLFSVLFLIYFLETHTGVNVLSYVNMVCASLRNSIPKSVVYCQVREAKRSLLDHFFTDLGKKEVSLPLLRKKNCPNFLSTTSSFFFHFFLQSKQLSKLLDEDPAIMQRRGNLGKRLELYRSAQQEIDAVAWSK